MRSKLINGGAKKVTAAITHAILSGEAIARIEGSKLDTLMVTDSIPLSDEAKQCMKIKVHSISQSIAKLMRDIVVAQHSFT